MNKFLKKIGIWTLGLVIFTVGFALYFCDSHFDPFYKRIASGKKTSLVLGNSRAAQGIVPSVINEQFRKNNSSLDLYNFGFSARHSPYGPWYLESIRNKLAAKDVRSTNEIFIISVDPWTVSALQYKDTPDDFEEKQLPPYRLLSDAINPNVEYLFKYYEFPRFNLILRKWLYKVKTNTLHADGWLEIRIDRDSLETLQNIKRHVRERIEEEDLPHTTLSKYRLQGLFDTIDLLKERGTVVLIRMPVPDLMKNLEDEYCPEFDENMKELGKEKQVLYWNFRNQASQFRFNDGNHLHYTSSRKFSLQLADSLVRLNR